MFFFFQAEDGIRDLTVTGVQTCALPIYRLDDSLDFIADQDRFGKAIGADLREGKRTLPLIAMLDRADPGERARVRAALEDGALSPPAIEEIRRLVLKHAGVEYALDRAHAYARAAKADLAPFPASEERETLALVAEFVV